MFNFKQWAFSFILISSLTVIVEGTDFKQIREKYSSQRQVPLRNDFDNVNQGEVIDYPPATVNRPLNEETEYSQWNTAYPGTAYRGGYYGGYRGPHAFYQGGHYGDAYEGRGGHYGEGFHEGGFHGEGFHGNRFHGGQGGFHGQGFHQGGHQEGFHGSHSGGFHGDHHGGHGGGGHHR